MMEEEYEKEDRRCNNHCLAIKKFEEILMRVAKKGDRDEVWKCLIHKQAYFLNMLSGGRVWTGCFCVEIEICVELSTSKLLHV